MPDVRVRPGPALATPLALALAALLTPACSDDAQFTTRFASDFAHGRHAVSVFGVFKDGRMDGEAWEVIGPKLSAPFGATCESAYGSLLTSDQPLSAAIDDYVRANGPGDELLDRIAPAATGDLVVVFTMAGKVVPKEALKPDTSTLSSSSPGMGMGGGKYRGARPGGGAYGSRGMAAPGGSPAALELSASLFSVSQHKSVAMVSMAYDGPSADDALQRMAAKLAASVPGSTCVGWDWKGKVDASRIRELGGQ
jgi:hypothetical protein